MIVGADKPQTSRDIASFIQTWNIQQMGIQVKSHGFSLSCFPILYIYILFSLYIINYIVLFKTQWISDVSPDRSWPEVFRKADPSWSARRKRRAWTWEVWRRRFSRYAERLWGKRWKVHDWLVVTGTFKPSTIGTEYGLMGLNIS
jgi:hypothetical protein